MGKPGYDKEQFLALEKKLLEAARPVYDPPAFEEKEIAR